MEGDCEPRLSAVVAPDHLKKEEGTYAAGDLAAAVEKKSDCEQGWTVGRSQTDPIAQGLPQQGSAEP